MHKKNVRETHSQKSRETLKRETALKNSFFNRYMLFRYSLALFFFSNVYWLIILWTQVSFYIIIPIILLIFIVWSYAEQFRMCGTKNVYLTITRGTLYFQGIVQLLLLLMIVMTNQFSTLFPIFADNQVGHLFIAIILILGLLLVFYNLGRIQEILANKDRYYVRFQTIEKYHH